MLSQGTGFLTFNSPFTQLKKTKTTEPCKKTDIQNNNPLMTPKNIGGRGPKKRGAIRRKKEYRPVKPYIRTLKLMQIDRRPIT